ncbi:MFS general substrate transporter [Crucibulum laeve]|uniref:MFS general substrate transporter n=1 Tax=Crucibulum laeve TaxID=68775 RepID=A0A5C3LDQ5_9AGAR|nr:MFS general substrate transporter [Crucibulum laeve]
MTSSTLSFINMDSPVTLHSARSHSSNQVEKPKDQRHVQMDGGARAWATLLGGFCVTTATFGYVNSFGVYQDVYTRSHAASASSISWIGSTQIFFLMAMGLLSGKLLDIGYFKQTTFVGSVIFVFSIFMVSIAHHDKYYQLYLCQGLGMGIGAGLLYVPAMAIQTHYWRSRRALAMGIVITGTSAGGIIFPIMLNQLFKGSAGFAWGVRISAFICLGLLILGNILMTTNPEVLAEGKPKPDIKAIVTDVPYMICSIGGFFPDGDIIDFYLQLFSILHGVDSNIAFYTLAIMNAAAIPGRVLPNILADKLGPINVIIPAVFGCAVLVFAIFGVKSAATAIVFAILYGFFSGAWLSLCSPVVASFSIHPSESG